MGFEKVCLELVAYCRSNFKVASPGHMSQDHARASPASGGLGGGGREDSLGQPRES